MFTDIAFPVLPGALPTKSDPKSRFVEVPFAKESGPLPTKLTAAILALVPLLVLAPISGHIQLLPLK